MLFKYVIQNGWPVARKHITQVSIEDPSDDQEVLMTMENSDSLAVEMLRREAGVELILRDRSSKAVMDHLVPC